MTNLVNVLKDSSIVVIGGTAGIGQAIAIKAAAAGARVTVASRDRQKVEAMAASLGASARGAVVDLTDSASTLRFFKDAGEIDHLVLPGSRVFPGPFKVPSTSDAEASFNSKFWGPYRAIHAARMSKAGSIVLFSGIASRKPGFGWPAVTALNAAVEALGKALAVELAPVRVNVISPGVVDTGLWGNDNRSAMLASMTAKLPVPRAGRPEEIAAVAMGILTSTFMTGAVIDVDGGALAA